MPTVPWRANLTFAVGATMFATSLTLAFGVPSAAARPITGLGGHGTAAVPKKGDNGTTAAANKGDNGTAAAAKKGDNGTVKIHRSTTAVTDRRNEPHVCVFYLDAFGFDPGQSVSWLIRSWPPTGDRTVVDQGTLTLDSAGDGRTSDQMLSNGHYKLFWNFTGEHGAAKQKVFWVSCPAPSSSPSPSPTSSVAPPAPPAPSPTPVRTTLPVTG